jgi:hypothetical protein
VFGGSPMITLWNDVFVKLQLGCHPVAAVQCTLTGKQHTERHKKTIRRTTQKFWKSAGRAPYLRVIPWNLPCNWAKSTERP